MIGIEEKDMIINRIPAKTWNHLHMNQSRVGEVVINRTGELNASVNDVSLIDDGKLNNGELDNIIGGCGQEITEAAKKSQTEPVYYITDKKNAGFVRLDFNYGNRLHRLRRGRRCQRLQDQAPDQYPCFRL